MKQVYNINSLRLATDAKPIAHTKRIALSLCTVALWILISSAQAAPTVPVIQLSKQAVKTSYELDAVVESTTQTTLSSQASGRVMSVLVKAGDLVKSGQLLATIDDRDATTQVQRSQAITLQAQAQLQQDQINVERAKALHDKGFVSQSYLDSARTQLSASTANHDQTKSALAQTRLQHSFNRVVAPYDGVVQELMVQQGDLAHVGRPLFTVYAPKQLRAVAHIPSSRTRAAQQSSQIEVQIPNAGAEPTWIKPTKTSMLPNMDSVSQTNEWRFDLPATAAMTLQAGQMIRVRFTQGQTQALMLPSSAILRRGELTAVYVVRGNSFVLSVVRLGAAHGNDGYEILAGLAPNDRVALDPVQAGIAGATPIISTKP